MYLRTLLYKNQVIKLEDTTKDRNDVNFEKISRKSYHKNLPYISHWPPNCPFTRNYIIASDLLQVAPGYPNHCHFSWSPITVTCYDSMAHPEVCHLCVPSLLMIWTPARRPVLQVIRINYTANLPPTADHIYIIYWDVQLNVKAHFRSSNSLPEVTQFCEINTSISPVGCL